MDALLSTAAALGIKAVQLELKNEEEIDDAIGTFAAAGGNGLIGNSDAFNLMHRARIIKAAIRHRLPTMFPSRNFTASGGLISYGPYIEAKGQATSPFRHPANSHFR